MSIVARQPVHSVSGGPSIPARSSPAGTAVCLMEKTSGRELNLGGDVTMMLSERTSLHLFANHQEIKSERSGSQTFSTPDWSGENKDTITYYGFGVKHVAIKDKLDVGANYAVTRSTGAIRVSTAADEHPVARSFHATPSRTE